MQMHRWAQTDMHYYDAWAQQIAAGDWLARSVAVPMHRWHWDTAQIYLTKHPEERTAPAPPRREDGRVDAGETRLWSRWMRLPRFYQDPLYAYMVAMTYRVAGPDARRVLAWQAALGVASVVLIWLLAARYFGETVGLVAGAMALLSGPLLFYEVILLRDSTIVCISLLLVWLMDHAIYRNAIGWYAAWGTALALSFLLKSSLLLLGVGLLIGVGLGFRGRWRQAVRPAVAVMVGGFLVLAPLVARNRAVGVPAFSLAQSGPLTLMASNDISAQPDVGFGINAPLLAGFLGETDGSWGAAVRGVLTSQSVGSYAALVWRKWDRLWHWYEIPNNENFYYARSQAPVLAALPFTFAFGAPLALVGLVLAIRRASNVWPLYLLAGLSAAPVLIFYVLGRLRLPLVAAVMPFAALTVVDFARAVRVHRYARAVTVAGAVTLLALWTDRPLASDQVLVRMSDWILPWSVSYQTQVYDALDAHQWARGAAAYVEFFERYEPTDAEIIAAGDRTLAPELADMHRECAGILLRAGQPAQAQQQLTKADHLEHLTRVR